MAGNLEFSVDILHNGEFLFSKRQRQEKLLCGHFASRFNFFLIEKGGFFLGELSDNEVSGCHSCIL